MCFRFGAPLGANGVPEHAAFPPEYALRGTVATLKRHVFKYTNKIYSIDKLGREFNFANAGLTLD
jgi:hypothetical protein